MNKPHVTAWLIVLALLVAFAGYWRHEGAQAARDAYTIDSLAAYNHLLATAASRAEQVVDSQHQREAAALQDIRGRDLALRAATGRTGTLLAALRDSASVRERALIDSLEALHAQTDSLLTSQRDSYRALFLGASASRDTLAALLRASEAQIAGLQVALVKARHVPLWNTPAVKVVQLALALKGVASVFGH